MVKRLYENENYNYDVNYDEIEDALERASKLARHLFAKTDRLDLQADISKIIELIEFAHDDLYKLYR